MGRIFSIVASLLLIAFLVESTAAANESKERLPLTWFIASLDHASKNSLRDMPSIAQTGIAFAGMLEAALSGDSGAAEEAAARAGYRIRQIMQEGRAYLVLFDERQSAGPTIVLAKTPQRDLIIEAPHGIADRATDIQSAIALTRLGARALILAGAHRCASRSESVCSGRTRICGDGRAPYRTSDAAHSTDTRFHTAHLMLADAWPDAMVVQLHGFGVKGTDAWVVLSDGSEARRPGDSALVGQVRDSIRGHFGRPERAVSCQDPEDERFSYRTLCARINVQGRHLNGVGDVCRATAETASGCFLHIEQAWEIRREVRQNWEDIDGAPLATIAIDSLGVAIPCTLSACQ